VRKKSSVQLVPQPWYFPSLLKKRARHLSIAAVPLSGRAAAPLYTAARRSAARGVTWLFVAALSCMVAVAGRVQAIIGGGQEAQLWPVQPLASLLRQQRPHGLALHRDQTCAGTTLIRRARPAFGMLAHNARNA
jgi:hypothetical protein